MRIVRIQQKLLRFAEMIERLSQEAHLLDQFGTVWALPPRLKSVALVPLKNHCPCNFPSLPIKSLRQRLDVWPLGHHSHLMPILAM